MSPKTPVRIAVLLFFAAAIVGLWSFREEKPPESTRATEAGFASRPDPIDSARTVPPASAASSPSMLGQATAPTAPASSLPKQIAKPGPSATASALSTGRRSTRSAPNAQAADGSTARILAAVTVADVLENADLSQPDVRALAVARISELQEVQRESAFEKAARLGIPTRIDGPGSKISILYDFRGDAPLYRTTRNVNAAISSGAKSLQAAPYGLDGTGVTVAVWDGGSVRGTHQEFGARVTKKDSATSTDDHATHVAGTIGAAGVDSRAKGMAPQVRIDSYDWNSDYTEMTAAGAATSADAAKIPISNHSYGYNAVADDMGRYETEARTVDALAVSLPYYLVFWAAGNEQTDLPSLGGYQSITFVGLAKNIMTIGAVNDAVAGGLRTPSAGAMSDFSSWGPCDDGRIKPDVVANGVGLFSSVATGNSAYDTYQGTSMATPSAAGSAALLEQLYAQNFSGQRLRSSMLRGLLIHTADDLGTAGPDYKHGWGLIHVKAAADLILAQKSSLGSPKMIEGTVTNAAKVRTTTFQWDGSTPIRATLCWTDPAGAIQSGANSRTPNLVNNLDLRITAPDGTTIYLPYTMPFVGTWTQASMASAATKGKNNVDNVERVDVPAPTQAGIYTVTVSVTGSISNTTQAYSLVVTGGADVPVNPPPTVTLDSPASGTIVGANTTVTLTATASDLVVSGGPGVVSQVEFFNGATSLGVDVTAPYSLSWTPPSGGTYVLSARATDSEGAVASSASSTLIVLSGNGQPGVASFSPASGVAGTPVVITGSNFAGVTSVRFNGGTSTSYTVDSLTQITASVPPTATTGPIGVVTGLGTGTSTSNFTVVQSPVLISQIYGGGGQLGATFNSDYVELYNRSDATVSLTGWSLQYASASGTNWQTASLTGSVAAGKYYLVKLSGGFLGTALPTADATASINLSASNGKVALVNSSTALTGSAPIGSSGLQDFVGYGTANAYEGAGAAPSPSTKAAIFRAGGGSADAGNNAADFSKGTPNPRNSAGIVVAPVITSSTAVGGTVGTAFTYQIAASNGPTSFGATGLPAGLSANATTGLISGTPTAAGTSNATISATNSAGTGSAGLNITVTASGGGVGTQLFSEDFSSITVGNSTSTGGSGSVWTGNTNFPTVASAYQAGGAVKLGTGSLVGSITSRALDLSVGGGNFSVSFKVKGWSSIEGGIKVTVTGLAPQTVSYDSVMADSFETKILNFTGGTSNSTVKIETTARRAFIDDVVVTTTPAASPLITANGTLSAVTTTYGTASVTPASFIISGLNMTAGILVTAPAGFEVSQTVGGATGYAPTQTVGGSGSVSPTTVYLRLAATTGVGSYSGNVVCTSSGALPVNVPTVSSDVRPKVLTITAYDRLKPFGTTLTLGGGQTLFASAGLVNGETVGTVTLAASGGLSIHDPLGTYTITPSNVTGGTFASSNYDVSYQAGILFVTGQDFWDWIRGKHSGSNGFLDADPEGDGLSNLLEFFMGLDPTLGDGAAVVEVAVVGDQFSLTYRKSKSAIGVTGEVKWKSDLATVTPWSSVGVTDTLVSDQGAYEIRRASVILGLGETRKFLRLDVTTP